MLSLAACGDGEPVDVGAAPTVSGPAAHACTELTRDLPEVVDGRHRRDTEPASDLVWAWGDPPVVMRCGVPRPAESVPGAQLIEVNDVDWTLDERPAGYVFTTYGRAAFVEVTVPKSVPRERATNPLVDLAAPVGKADPEV